MGGGDLNSKKAWHPNTLKNQERVWKAEQAAAEEKKRIVELEHERQLERERTELNKLAKSNLGSTGASNDDRLHWMYEKPDKKVQQEEYLLGRAIDKNLEQAGKSIQDEIPAVSRRVVGSSMLTIAGDTQVDLARKMREDPLLLVKERERAARAALLNNPVQRARLTELLRKEQEKKKESKSKKKKKKDKDLDNILSEKLQALGGKKGIDLASLLASDDSSSESSENKSKKKKKKKKKEKKGTSKKEMSSDDEMEEEKHSCRVSKKEIDEMSNSKKKRKSTNESNSDADYKRKRKDHSVDKKKVKSDRKQHPKDSSDDYESNDDETQSKNYQHPSYKYSKDEKQLKGERYWKNVGQITNNHYAVGERSSKDCSYSRDGQQSKDNRHNTEGRLRDDEYSRDKHRPQNYYSYEKERRHDQKASSSKDKERESDKKRSGLSEEEKAAKLAEMAAAGAEREKQRERRVAEQLREKDKAERAPTNQSRPRNLISQLPESLESRIHSNRHYIQRDQRHMNENFARR